MSKRTTSQKHRSFISEPMGSKSVRELPGVGPTIGGRLESRGYEKASAVVGQYLVQNRSDHHFQQWMRNECQANAKQASDCNQGVRQWCDQFL